MLTGECPRRKYLLACVNTKSCTHIYLFIKTKKNFLGYARISIIFLGMPDMLGIFLG